MIQDVINEQKKAVDDKHGPIKSLHEAYALALEEYQEVTAELNTFTKCLEDYWNGIKLNYINDKTGYYGTLLAKLVYTTERICEESVDLAVVMKRVEDMLQAFKIKP